jgi:DNA invertase Pin-like site-specific DNA recombinase
VTVYAAIYCRISSDRDDTQLGVERQEKDCRKLVKAKGWKPIEPPYVDNDITAADPKKKRPGYQRLLRDISSGKVNAVVVWDEDRLHRRPTELEAFVEACDKAGMTQLASVGGGGVDLNDEDALMLLRIKGAMAKREVDKTKKRIKAQKLQMAEQGLPSGGGRSFGYEEGNMVVREKEATLIRQAADDILAGRTNYAIIKAWTETGVRTARGNKWSQQAFRTMMTGPRIAGKRQHGKDQKGRAIVLKDDHGDDVVAKWPAILDQTTWESVRNKLFDPSRRQPPPSRDYPLRGILICGAVIDGHVCGKFLKAQPAERRRMYCCKKETGGCGKVYVSGDRIEEFVFGELLPLADNPALRDIVRAEQSQDRDELVKLVQEKSDYEHKLVKFRGYLANDTWTEHEYNQEKRKVSAAKDQIDARIAGLQGQSVLDRLGGQVQDEWDSMTADDKRGILKSLVTEIRVTPAIRRGSNVFDPRRVTIIYRFDSMAKVAKADGKVHVGSGYITLAGPVKAT